MGKRLLFWGTVFTVLLLDQVSKGWALQTLEFGHSLPVLRGIFHITLTHNTGIAFGLLADKGWLTIPLSFLVMLAILWYRHQVHAPPHWRELGFGLLFGGALSNLLDRLRYGYVIDLIDFRVWPVFNLADTAITLAVLIFLVSQLFKQRSAEEGTSVEVEEEETRVEEVGDSSAS